MDVGMGIIFQSLGGPQGDAQQFVDDLRIADLAEPLGFDSVWCSEHHFTDYNITPAPLQFLSYVAGRTSRVALGSDAVILPWHDPVRLAAEVTLLDHLSQGRAILGIGRGLGAVEFDGFRVPMAESRERFEVGAQILLDALESGVLESDHPMYRIPRRDLRPPAVRSFRDRSYGVAVSSESLEAVARLRLGLLCAVQKPWDTVDQDFRYYRDEYTRLHDAAPPPLAAVMFVFCDEDAGRARDLASHFIGIYYRVVLSHYELDGRHFKNTKGYEFYARGAETMAAAGAEKTAQFFTDLHVWGTPDQCMEKIMRMHEMGVGTFIANLSYGGMPPEEVERNVRLFASEVMPRMQAVGSPALTNAG